MFYLATFLFIGYGLWLMVHDDREQEARRGRFGTLGRVPALEFLPKEENDSMQRNLASGLLGGLLLILFLLVLLSPFLSLAMQPRTTEPTSDTEAQQDLHDLLIVFHDTDIWGEQLSTPHVWVNVGTEDVPNYQQCSLHPHYIQLVEKARERAK